MDVRAGSNLCKQLMQRENIVCRDPWHYQASIFRQRLSFAKSLYQRNLNSHWGCVNALEFSNGGEYLASGGDDKRVLVWNVEKSMSNIGKPVAMRGEHTSNIFCLGFDNSNSTVYSGGNDECMMKHDFETRKTVNYFSHLSPIYGLSVDKTSNNLVSTATEDGELLVYDMRAPDNDPLVIARFGLPFNAVEFHPLNGNYIVSANSTRGASLWDLRSYEEPVIQYKYLPKYPSCMSVRFNATGTHILTLHRRLPPILYNTNSKEPVCTFFDSDYFNSCTMKSCSFAGPDDELILSGSDDFNLYVWRLKDVDFNSTAQWVDTADIILYGHRSIVNQVRYNRQRCLIASSGVEKTIKLWSPFKQEGWSGDLYTKPPCAPKTRELYPHNSMSDFSQEFNIRNNEEDRHMLAFFDSLVQRELEDWDTDSSNLSVESTHPTGVNAIDSNVSAAANPNDANSSAHSDCSWMGHPNRIAFLISQKHHSLLRLAVQGSTTSRGRAPLRVRSHSPIVMVKTNPPSLDWWTTSPSINRRRRLYSSPTRMLCWLQSFEIENYNDSFNINHHNGETATTSAEARRRAMAVTNTASRASHIQTGEDTSTDSVNDEIFDTNLRLRRLHSTHNGATNPLWEEQEHLRQRKRKFINMKRLTNTALEAKRSRTVNDTEDDEDGEIEAIEDVFMVSETTNNTNNANSDNNGNDGNNENDGNDDNNDNGDGDDEQVQDEASHTSNESDIVDDESDDDDDDDNSRRSTSNCTEYTDSGHVESDADDETSEDDESSNSDNSDSQSTDDNDGDDDDDDDDDSDKQEDSIHNQINEPPSSSHCNGTKDHKHLEPNNNNNGETNNNTNNTNGNNSNCVAASQRSSSNEYANQINKTPPLARSSLVRK